MKTRHFIALMAMVFSVTPPRLLPDLIGVSHASGLSDAFSSGQALGSAGVASAQGAITAGQGASVVPNYTGAAPESSYFAGGQGSLFAPATGKISNCATGPQASTAYGQQDCDAVNFLARNPAVRPQIAVGKNDPLVAGAKAILANPQALAGSMTGNYSACSTATVNQPATYDTEVCNQYTNMTQSKCQRVLTVTVSPPIQATLVSTGWFVTCVVPGNNSTCVFRLYPYPLTFTPLYTCNQLGNFPYSTDPYPVPMVPLVCGTTSYSCPSGYSLSGSTCYSSSVTKSWDNQCAALEAQAQ